MAGENQIERRHGDVLTSEAEALVNTVNCVGIMGRGVALQFRKAYPENYDAYRSACDRGAVQPGRMFVFATGRLTGPKFIINFPTKRHWRGKSRMGDIEAGLEALVDEIRDRHIRSIAIPPLGCGLGGLNWDQVKARIIGAMAQVPDVHVLLYEPGGLPPLASGTRSAEPPRMTAGRAALVALMQRYLAGLMEPFITLLEVHKLMYFLQEAGQPLSLRYVAAPYGPYAENLRHQLNQVEGHFISGYGDGGDAPDKELQLVPGADADAAAFLAKDSTSKARIGRVSSLVDGFETPFGLELLATVHWVATRQEATSPEAAIRATYAWGANKRQFSERQIRLAWEMLRYQGWIADADPEPPGIVPAN